jgi:hypothetical protein
MRMGDLMHCEVVDAGGTRLGKVRDVRLVQDGRIVEGFGALLRVDGLVVGKGALAERLGLHRTNVHGPWPLTAVLRRLERRAHYARWDQVASLDRDTVSLAVPVDDLISLADVP